MENNEELYRKNRQWAYSYLTRKLKEHKQFLHTDLFNAAVDTIMGCIHFGYSLEESLEVNEERTGIRKIELQRILKKIDFKKDMKKSILMNDIERVKNYFGWDDEQLAKRLGVSKPAVYNWTSGINGMSTEVSLVFRDIVKRMEKSGKDKTESIQLINQIKRNTPFKTNTDIGEQIEVSTSAVSTWTTGRYKPSEENYEKLLGLLNGVNNKQIESTDTPPTKSSKAKYGNGIYLPLTKEEQKQISVMANDENMPITEFMIEKIFGETDKKITMFDRFRRMIGVGRNE